MAVIKRGRVNEITATKFASRVGGYEIPIDICKVLRSRYEQYVKTLLSKKMYYVSFINMQQKNVNQILYISRKISPIKILCTKQPEVSTAQKLTRLSLVRSAINQTAPFPETGTNACQ